MSPSSGANFCSFPPLAFLHNDSVRGPLQLTYDGPYEVIERRTKNFVFKLHGRTLRVDIKRSPKAEFQLIVQITQEMANKKQKTEANNFKTRSSRKI